MERPPPTSYLEGGGNGEEGIGVPVGVLSSGWGSLFTHEAGAALLSVLTAASGATHQCPLCSPR